MDSHNIWEMGLFKLSLLNEILIIMLEKETLVFEQNLPELIKTDLSKFVLIKDDQIIGTFVAIFDALKAGYEKFRDQPFFVRQVLPAQQPLNFANNFLLQ